MTISIKVLSFMLLTTFLVSSCDDDTPSSTPETTLPSTVITSIYIDNNDIVWVGTAEGLACYNGKKWITYTQVDGVAGDSISDIKYDKSPFGDEIWTATQTGSSVHAYDVDGITAATVYRTSNTGMESDNVYAVGITPEDTKWFATDGSISALSDHEWLTKSFGLIKMPINCMTTSQDTFSYIGTSGSGAVRYKLDSNDVDGISGASMIDINWSRIPSNTVFSIYVDNNNNQWYGTNKGVAYHVGFEIKDPSKWTTYNTDDGLICDTVISIFEDSEGAMWFGTTKGLSCKNGDTWNNYTINEGLSSNMINGIAEDSKGVIWVATDNGISKYTGDSWEIIK